MDRNSLLAFLLIAVIIFLMPEYYKLVYPPTPGSDSLIVNIDEQAKAVKPPDKKATLTPSYNKGLAVEKSFSVRTNLYTAEISTTNGGSIASFVLHN